MNTELLIPVIRLVCGTGMLYLIYVSLLKKRVNGNFSRVFIMLGTIVFSLLAFVNFDITPQENVNRYLISLPTITLGEANNDAPTNSHFNWLILVYTIPTILASSVFFRNMYQIFRLRKHGKTVIQNGIAFIENTDIRYPFSFGSHIYLPKEMDDKSRALVIEHEIVHIKHFHTADVIFFELLKIFGWFNPFYYLLGKELRQVHEFTVDEIVLKNGTSSQQYCEALLACALIGMRVPANYFNGSQIKTRIYMMNKKKNMRQAVVLFSAAVLMVGGISATTPHLIGMEPSPMVIVSEPDKMPEYPGGNEAMAKFIINNLKYPEAAKKAKVEGRVMVQFVVDEKGKVTEPKVLRGIGSGCDEEAIRTVKLMPDWKPGEKDGKPVAVEMVLPIAFKLQ